MLDSLNELLNRLEEIRKRDGDFLGITSRDEALLDLEAHRGDTAAAYWLGRMYLDQERNEEAHEWIERAAKAGVPYAVSLKATMAFKLVASQWPWQLSDSVVSGWRFAADRGDYVAQTQLAIHGERLESPLSRTERFTLLEHAADAGYVPAVILLAEHCYRGSLTGRDLCRAAALFQQAFDLSDEHSWEALWLAIIHLEGHGVIKDVRKGMGYLHAYAAARSRLEPERYRDGFGGACVEMANIYSLGWIVGHNQLDSMVKALFWYAQGARIGTSEGVFQLLGSASRLLACVDKGSGLEVDAIVMEVLKHPQARLSDWAPSLDTWAADVDDAIEHARQVWDKV